MMARWTGALAAVVIGCAAPCAGQAQGAGGGAATQQSTAAEGQLATLLRMSASPDKKVRKNAAKMLGETRDPRAVEALIGALRDANDDVREEAAVALGAIGDRRAVPALVAALNDGDGSVRTRAVNSLGELGDPRAVMPLIAMLLDEEDPFRVTNIQRALRRLGARERISVRE